MFINKAAAKRILEAKFNKTVIIVKVWRFANSVCVLYRVPGENLVGRTAMNAKLFLNDGLTVRKNRVENEPHKIWYGQGTPQATVQFAEKDSHMVNLNPNKIECSCGDFVSQKEHSSGFNIPPVCSHLLAAAKGLGFGSLAEYVKSAKASTLHNNLAAIA